MDICLASTSTRKELFDIGEDSLLYKSSALLESFWYWEEWQNPYFEKCPLTILDSGAFTMMYCKASKGKYDIDSYCDQYIDFINSHKWVEHYIELDVDKVFGYDKALELRRRLESRTGKQSMPVMHTNRTKEDYIAMCKDYDYVCLGDMAGCKEVKNTVLGVNDWFVDVAHENNCKVHALGYTSPRDLKSMSFDSADSSTWLSGGRFANLFLFNGMTLDVISKPPNCMTPPDKGYLMLDGHNFSEWLKWQTYARDFY